MTAAIPNGRIFMWVAASRCSSGQIVQLLQVRIEIAQDARARSEHSAVLHRSSASCPELDIARKVSDQCAQFTRDRWSRERQAEHDDRDVCCTHGFQNLRGRKVCTEVRHTEAAAGGQHRGTKGADLMAIA